jgi:predicted porin
MKKTLIAAAALATLGTTALAQSSVQVYGRVNVTVERQKVDNRKNDWVMQNNASRIGFKGSEDLGGGLKAGFQLEHGFNINNGQQSQSAFWARQSEVNLGGGFGMIRLGNFTSESYYATADYVSMHNHDTGTSADRLYAYLGRDTSKVAYRTPSFGGVTIEGAVTEGGAGERTFDFAANYDAGPLHLGAGYQKANPTDKNASQFAFRALYELGAFTFGGYVQRDKDGFGDGLGNRTAYRLSGMYALGNNEFHVNWGRAGAYSNRIAYFNADPVNRPLASSANQYTLGYNYNLSKRTKAYAFYTKVADRGDSATRNGAYGDFSAIAVGVRHNF